jgi:hypothetical protein
MIIPNKLCQQALGASIGTSVCLLIIFVAHAHLIPSESSFNPASSCSSPPLDCWDGLSKPHYKCVTYEQDTILRSGVAIKAGQRSCYKSVYFNLDSTAFAMIAMFFIWASLTSRAVEAMIVALLNDGKIRWPVVAGLITSMPSVWYVCSVMIHYMNDRYFPYYYSQLFFTLSELSCQIISIIHVPKNEPVFRYALVYLGGTALSHLIQICMDEPFLVTSNPGTTFRNFSLFIGDAFNLYAAYTLSGKWRRKIWYFAWVSTVQLIAFYFFFADKASFTIFS